MPDTEEKVPVLNLDSGNTLTGIHHALESYAQTVPGMAVAQVTFEQQPNVDGDLWRAIARIRCFGDLQRTADVPTDGGKSFLANAEPQLVYEHSWQGLGVGFVGSVEDLRDKVEDELQSLIAQRQQDLVAANEALRTLRNPTELNNIWSLSDDPQDEPPQEG